MGNLSRREFLEHSMLAATAAVGTASLGRELLAKEKAPVGANDRLRVAVLGVRGRGQSHLQAFAGRPDTEVAVICDPDEEIGRSRVEGIAKATGKAPRFVQDLRQIYDDKSIDIVSIATPNHWHALAAIWAMQAGKDVYVEKPVSHNISEGRRIVEAARKYGRICQTGTQVRSSTGIQQAMAYLHAGELGKVKISRGLCYKRRKSIGKVSGPQEVPSHIDYNLWTGPAPMKPLMRARLHYDWHWDFDYGNGDLGNQGIHQMDLARWAMGVDRLADEVVSLGGRFGYIDDGNTPNTIVSFFKYGDRQLIFETRGLETEKYRGAAVGDVFHCEGGYLAIGSYVGAAAFDLDGKMIKQFSGGGDHFDNFVKAVRSRSYSDLNADIEEGHLSSALCHLGNISYHLGSEESFADCTGTLNGNYPALETVERMKFYLAKAGIDTDTTKIKVGRRLAFNPESETFVDDSQADALLTRDYREPFVVPSAEAV